MEARHRRLGLFVREVDLCVSRCVRGIQTRPSSGLWNRRLAFALWGTSSIHLIWGRVKGTLIYKRDTNGNTNKLYIL